MLQGFRKKSLKDSLCYLPERDQGISFARVCSFFILSSTVRRGCKFWKDCGFTEARELNSGRGGILKGRHSILTSFKYFKPEQVKN